MVKCTYVTLLSIIIIAVTQLVADPPDPPANKHWEPVDALCDEFNGNSLDRNKWDPDHPYWNGREPSQFNSANVFVSGGNLCLRSTVRNHNQSGNWIWAACAASKSRNFLKGYYSECRIKCSNITMTTAYWMQGKGIEIDVIENMGNPTTTNYLGTEHVMYTNTIYDGERSGWNGKVLYPACDETYWVYGVWWKNATTVIFYLNEKVVATITPKGPFDKPMYMFFDTEAFTWRGLPTIASLEDTSINTAKYEWVRTYKLEHGTPIINNTKPQNLFSGLSGKGKIEICDTRGRVLQTIVIDNMENSAAVKEQLRAHKNRLSGGLYIYRIIAGNKTIIQKNVRMF